MRKQYIVMVSLVIGLSMVLTACSPTATPTTTPPVTEAVTEVATEAVPEGMLPEVDPASLTGDINIAGSSTVYPLSEAVAENFNKDGFTGNVNIASVGTGGGFERFCKTGETDIANASRAIKDSEMEACAALNPARVPLEFRVGTDAIAVVVSKENTFAKDITLEELGLLFTSAEKWSDVRADWPAEPIQRFTPGTDSGTFDFFVEVVIQKPQKIEKLDDAKKLALDATNIQTSEDDNVLVQGVEGSPYAIGYFGFAYYKQQESRLIALSVDGIAPSFETAESGEYVLARPLFIYSDANVLKQKPQVAGFINYFLTYVNEWIDDVGYFPASEEALNTARQLFLDAVK